MESLFQALDQSADGAFVIDDNQRIVYWNAAAQAILGYSREEVLGRLCAGVLRGRTEQSQVLCRHNCHVTTAVREGEEVTNFYTFVRTQSGHLRWLNISIIPFPVPGPNHTQLIVHLFRDTTDQKQREQFAQQVLEAAQQLHHAIRSQRTTAPAPVAPTPLTPRELEVLVMLAHGSTTAQIAQSLSISVATTRNHIQNIYHKLDVHGRAQVVAYAFEHGLVSDV